MRFGNDSMGARQASTAVRRRISPWVRGATVVAVLASIMAVSAAPGALARTSRSSSRGGVGPVIRGFGSSTDYTYLVDSTGDGSDTNLGDHACGASTGGCTLRAAIQQDNFNCGAANGTSTTIDFSIGSGIQTIAPLVGEPGIQCPTIVDGTTQPGYAGTPLIVLNGTNTNPNLAGGLQFFNVCNCGGALRGLVINGFDGDRSPWATAAPTRSRGTTSVRTSPARPRCRTGATACT